WSNPAYSPSTRLLYNGAVDWCATLTPTNTSQPKVTFDDPKQATGWIKAFHAATGKEAWSFHAPAPVLAGLTPTAANVLFAGDLAGNLYAFNATTGAIAWKTSTGGAVGGSVISYAIAGKQRIAVTSGMKSNVWPMASGSPSIVIYGLQ
ncbi:MAG: PQQ-binding-like beta-propeller repeat protein, partial [Terriglobus sp.]